MNTVTEESTTLTTDISDNTEETKARPDNELLYSYLFSGKITMEEYLFLCKKKIEGSVG